MSADPIDLADVPGAPARGTVLCTIDDLAPNEAKSFVFKHELRRFEMFVQRWGDDIFAYKNSCPHVRLPLDFRPGKFLDISESYLHCANHGALFQVDDGLCVKGPCKGQFLTPIRIARKGNDILVG